MTNSIEEYQSFYQDGLELVINTSTGEAFASQSATARMLGVDQGNLSRRNTYVILDKKTAEIQTATGLKPMCLISADQLFDLAWEIRPELARKMGSAGATVYLYGLAGYQIKPVEKSPSSELTRKEILLIALKAEEEAEQARAELKAAQPQIAIAEAVLKNTVALSMSDYQKTVKVNGVKLGRTTYYNLLRQIGVFAVGRPLPKQKFIDQGYFEIRDSFFSFEPVAWITPKGQSWLPGHIKEQLVKLEG